MHYILILLKKCDMDEKTFSCKVLVKMNLKLYLCLSHILSFLQNMFFKIKQQSVDPLLMSLGIHQITTYFSNPISSKWCSFEISIHHRILGREKKSPFPQNY